MKPLKVLHISDTHIGMENYGRIDPETGLHTRLRDFVKCLEFAVDTALTEGVDLALFAGDAYRTADPNPTHQREFAAKIRKLADAGIPVVMVTGNHDIPAAYGKASALDIFKTLGSEKLYRVITRPELITVETRSGPVQILGLPWPTRHALLTREEYKHLTDEEITRKIEESYTGIIDFYAQRLDPQIPSVLLAHLAAAEATYSGSERSAMIGKDPVFLTSVLANPAFDYVALGHIHKHQNLNPGGYPPVVYPGSIDRVDFGEEFDEKGFCMVSLKKGEASYRFLPTCARPFLTIGVNITNKEDPTLDILQEIDKYRPRLNGAVVRIFYTVDEERESLVDLKRVRAALEPAFLVAGIIRKTENVKRTMRVPISESLGMLEALDKYIFNNPDLQPYAEDLKSYATRLEQELMKDTETQRCEE
jgi:exonuclease SbcD